MKHLLRLLNNKTKTGHIVSDLDLNQAYNEISIKIDHYDNPIFLLSKDFFYKKMKIFVIKSHFWLNGEKIRFIRKNNIYFCNLHYGNKPYLPIQKYLSSELPRCQKSFSRLPSLLKHKIIDKGNKPYRVRFVNILSFTHSTILRS